MAVVTISFEIGAGGPEIGSMLAGRLGYRYVDHELISEAAHRYGLVEDRLSHLSDAKPSLFERFDVETRRYITVIQTVMFEFAAEDNVVLMGRGGQWLLRGIPHVLRVRVAAPFDVRVKRLTEKLSAQTGDRVTARSVTQMVRQDDTQRVGRMRYLYEVDLRDPALYDLALNTEALTPEAAVQVLADLARRPELAAGAEARQRVADRTLASRVQVALVTHPDTRKYRIEVEAREGVVTLESTTALDAAQAVAREVAGVREVRTRLVEIPPIPPFVA
ncbi:MAG: cytidylate kinase family protein [Candidatus Rokubacteria bacterium]|nr:cytidylate kinase family protein [Candidatus Rokubacteria bacterium]